MGWITDSKIAVFGIALLVTCGCNQAQVDNPDPVVRKKTADPNGAQPKKPTIKQTVTADSKEAVAVSIPAPQPNVELSDTQNSDLDENAMHARDAVENTGTADRIAAEDFPIPEGATNVTRDVGMITFRTGEIKKGASALSDLLANLKWKPRGDQMVESDMAILHFQKGTGTINVSLTLDDRDDPPVHVIIHGDGIRFADDEFSGGPAMEAEGPVFDDLEGFGSSDGFGATPTEFEGLALPKGIDSPNRSSSQFRSEMITSTESDLESVYEFFRKSATESNWKTSSEVQNKDDSAALTLTNDKGEMIVELQKHDGEIEINLAFRNPVLAKEQGFLPASGKARLVLANISKSETTIEVNNKTYKLAPEQGAENPKDGIRVDLESGTYGYTIKASGREDQSGKLEVVENGSWGLVVFPEQGHMAERMY